MTGHDGVDSSGLSCNDFAPLNCELNQKLSIWQFIFT